MTDAALDSRGYFPSTMTDWYRERPFKVAFALSVVVHAALIALIPGFRSVSVEPPPVMEVQIVPDESAPIPRVQEKPVPAPRIIQPRIEPAPEAVTRQPEPEQKTEPTPEPVVRQPQPAPLPEPELRQVLPEPPPAPRMEITRTPRVEPTPEFVVPKPELRPEPKAEPTQRTAPEPRVERQPEPPPLARVEPRQEPLPKSTVEPRPEPRIEPRSTEAKPAPLEMPPPVVQPRVEPLAVTPPVVAPPPAGRPAPPQQAAVQPPAVVAPQLSTPKVDEASQNRLLLTYGQSISKVIKQHQKYPPPAQRRGWEGTAEVLLQIAADGKVTGITLGKSSGHSILDDEALDMVRRASPLPQAPPDLRGRALVVTVPIVFKLQNS